jgi:hypothetical protein
MLEDAHAGTAIAAATPAAHIHFFHPISGIFTSW